MRNRLGIAYSRAVTVFQVTARGLTLIETLLVLVVISVILIMGIGQYQRYTQQRTIIATKAVVQDLFAAANKKYEDECTFMFTNLVMNALPHGQQEVPHGCMSATAETDGCPIVQVNPLFPRQGGKPFSGYAMRWTVISKAPSKIAVYLPVSPTLVKNTALFEKYRGLLRPAQSVSTGGCGKITPGVSAGEAAGSGCFMWQGIPANYSTVATKGYTYTTVAGRLQQHVVETEPSKDIAEKMRTEHGELKDTGTSRRCSLLEYKNMHGTLTEKDVEFIYH